MLQNFRKILKDARENHYAIGGFNTSNLEITQGILEAADKINSPVIIQVTEKALEYAGLLNLVDIVKNEARRYKIPICLHLDHAKSLDIIEQCLLAGFNSIMFDGSNLEFSQNILQTKKAKKLANKFGATIEAELGVLGGKEDSKRCNNNFTDPQKAKEFVEETKVDSIAISFGNNHGIPCKNEKLNFSLLEEIGKNVSIPLVFHGASSTNKNDVKKAIIFGIAKINIDTDIKLAFTDSIKKFQEIHPAIFDPREILGNSKDAVVKVVLEKIKLFGSGGR